MPAQKVYVPVWTKFTCILTCRLILLASCIAFHFYVFCLFFYIFTSVQSFSVGFDQQDMQPCPCFPLFHGLYLNKHKYFSQLGETVLMFCCRWFCALRAPANQDASLPSVSSVKSGPRWEGFPSKSTLRSVS